ncbi:eukaryotic aspartyl protease family protein [Striga asiatica]|uniref:Eukaryotic aspartyl protease family protein n=1 Tax=Striga asiatica TaxID=4170 RepID=A0A5A7P0X0_STRAF|nr:eukaryotic aspartyl protease family protein [Striga asiatica]
MASDESITITHSLSLLFMLSLSFLFTAEGNNNNNNNSTASLFFPLTSAPLTSHTTSFLASLAASPLRRTSSDSPPLGYSSKTPFRYSMALIVSLLIGTPAQSQRVVIDTGSQLSWILCHRKKTRNPPSAAATAFDPSLSSSFSAVPCSHPLCKPRIPDFTIPTTCDAKRLCHYSYFYADGTYAQGNLIREKISPTTPPIILGCAADDAAADAEGILGMNLGRLSFPLQAKLSQFSYCVPLSRRRPTDPSPTGAFYLGQNPNSAAFRYINLLTFPQNHRMPNLDPLAYTVPLAGIKIAGRILNIPETSFRPDAGGSGQTMIDSGTQYTYLVDAAYDKVREEVVRRTGGGKLMKKDFVYAEALDMCFDGANAAAAAARLIGDVAFVFTGGVEITVPKERIMDDVGSGVHCIAIGRSELLGVPSNIVGNFYQQNLWVEFDLVNRRVGFGPADCSRSV